jgi:hypothetical protein
LPEVTNKLRIFVTNDMIGEAIELIQILENKSTTLDVVSWLVKGTNEHTWLNNQPPQQ